LAFVGGAPRSHFRVPRLASLPIGRLHSDGGGDWYAGPSALPNLLAALRQRTALSVTERERVVTLTGPELWDVPYLFMTGHGNVRFSDEEVKQLRRWLEQGGFLHADDDYGMDKSFRREIARVFPDDPLVEVPLSHSIYHLVYDFPKGIPKIHEHAGLPAQVFGSFLAPRQRYGSSAGGGVPPRQQPWDGWSRRRPALAPGAWWECSRRRRARERARRSSSWPTPERPRWWSARRRPWAGCWPAARGRRS